MRKLLCLVLLLATSLAAMERQPNADYRARRVKLAEKMNGGLLVLFAGVEKPGPNDLYGFRQDDQFYYLTGWREPGAALVIAAPRPANDNNPARPYTEILFLPAHNLSQEKWTGPKLGAENPNVRQVTGFDRVEVLDHLRDELVHLIPSGRSTVYTDMDEDSPSHESLEWLRRANTFPIYAALKDADPLITSLRMIKDAGEIALIRKAIDASMAAHQAALKAIKPGMNEHDISALMQGVFLKGGCERPAYAPIVGSGFNSTVLHYSDDDGPVNDDDVIVMDVACEYSMYASDITRTAPANGHFTDRQREIYNIVLGAQKAAEDHFILGKSVLTGNSDDSLYKIALDYINAHGKDRHGQPLGKYFIHGLGHSVGLNVHDPADYTQPLERGMIFTLEPGIYIPEEKLGVRIEDMYLVGDDGKLIRLTAPLPHTAEEVEHAMQK
jgi:Xaa-Pro aminopeptidase